MLIHTLSCSFIFECSENFLSHEEQLKGFSSECPLPCSFILCHAHSYLQVRKIYCRVRSSWKGFHQCPLPWSFIFECSENLLSLEEQLKGFSSECPLPCSFIFKMFGKFLVTWGAAEWVLFWVSSVMLIDIYVFGKFIVTSLFTMWKWKISCHVRSSWMGFHQSVLCHDHLYLNVGKNFLPHEEQLHGFSSECPLPCSFIFKCSENFLSGRSSKGS